MRWKVAGGKDTDIVLGLHLSLGKPLKCLPSFGPLVIGIFPRWYLWICVHNCQRPMLPCSQAPNHTDTSCSQAWHNSFSPHSSFSLNSLYNVVGFGIQGCRQAGDPTPHSLEHCAVASACWWEFIWLFRKVIWTYVLKNFKHNLWTNNWFSVYSKKISNAHAKISVQACSIKNYLLKWKVGNSWNNRQ